MALCALNLLLVQGLGLHFHRHMHADAAGHPPSMHLRDTGVHLHEEAGHHHVAGDHASHPGDDVEVDPVGAGFAKFFKVWLGTTPQPVGISALLAVAPPAQADFQQPARRHPDLFFLRPPSNAPPLNPSVV